MSGTNLPAYRFGHGLVAAVLTLLMAFEPVSVPAAPVSHRSGSVCSTQAMIEPTVWTWRVCVTGPLRTLRQTAWRLSSKGTGDAAIAIASVSAVSLAALLPAFSHVAPTLMPALPPRLCLWAIGAGSALLYAAAGLLPGGLITLLSPEHQMRLDFDRAEALVAQGAREQALAAFLAVGRRITAELHRRSPVPPALLGLFDAESDVSGLSTPEVRQALSAYGTQGDGVLDLLYATLQKGAILTFSQPAHSSEELDNRHKRALAMARAAFDLTHHREFVWPPDRLAAGSVLASLLMASDAWSEAISVAESSRDLAVRLDNAVKRGHLEAAERGAGSLPPLITSQLYKRLTKHLQEDRAARLEWTSQVPTMETLLQQAREGQAQAERAKAPETPATAPTPEAPASRKPGALSDEDLAAENAKLLRFVEGDADQWMEIRGQLMIAARRFTHQQDEVEDFAHEVMVRLHRMVRDEGFRLTESKLRTFLTSAAYNEFFSRERQRRRTGQFDPYERDVPEVRPAHLDADHAQQKRLHAALAVLQIVDPQSHQIFMLREWEGHGSKEVAAQLGINSEKTVRTRLWRSKVRLQTLMTADPAFLERWVDTYRCAVQLTAAEWKHPFHVPVLGTPLRHLAAFHPGGLEALTQELRRRAGGDSRESLSLKCIAALEELAALRLLEPQDDPKTVMKSAPRLPKQESGSSRLAIAQAEQALEQAASDLREGHELAPATKRALSLLMQLRPDSYHALAQQYLTGLEQEQESTASARVASALEEFRILLTLPAGADPEAALPNSRDSIRFVDDLIGAALGSKSASSADHPAVPLLQEHFQQRAGRGGRRIDVLQDLFVGKHSAEEIAADRDISMSLVGKYVWEARKKVREVLARLGSREAARALVLVFSVLALSALRATASPLAPVAGSLLSASRQAVLSATRHSTRPLNAAA